MYRHHPAQKQGGGGGGGRRRRRVSHFLTYIFSFLPVFLHPKKYYAYIQRSYLFAVVHLIVLIVLAIALWCHLRAMHMEIRYRQAREGV